MRDCLVVCSPLQPEPSPPGSVDLNGLDEYMTYREPLPEECPPDEAEAITRPQTVFRLVRQNPPSDDDFRSQRALKPNNQFRVPECQARGLSVFSQIKDARKQLKMPILKGMLICHVTLDKGAGYILRTGRQSHLTWWPLANFDVLNVCRMVDV